MPKIEVWKCPHTSKLFEDEKRYRNHLKALSRQRIARRKYQEIRNSVNDIIKGAQNVANAQELVDYIIEHQKEFMIYGTFNDSTDARKMHEALEKGWKIHFPKLRELTIDTRWSSEVSNSHNCPRDGYTNWGGNNKDGRNKRSYPGWQGRIEMSLDEYDRHIVITRPGRKGLKSKPIKFEAPTLSEMGSGFGNSASLSGINTGSGGGGLTHNSYEVRLFQSDFPAMGEMVTWALISGDGKKPTWGNSPRYEELDELGRGSYKLEEAK